MLNKLGDVCYRSKTSQCQKCLMYIKDYKCFNYDYIPYRVWENIVGYECDRFKSILKDQLNSHYIHRDYSDELLFPEKKFGGIHRFDKFGNIIGDINE